MTNPRRVSAIAVVVLVVALVVVSYLLMGLGATDATAPLMHVPAFPSPSVQ